MEEVSNKKRKLSLDWNKLLDGKDDDGGDDRPVIDSGENNRLRIESMTDDELAESIVRNKCTYAKWARKLPDKGQKIKDFTASLEKEKERRARNWFEKKDTRSVEMEEERNERTVKEHIGSDMPAHPRISGIKGKSTGVKQVAPPSSRPQSQFGSLFCHKVEEDV